MKKLLLMILLLSLLSVMAGCEKNKTENAGSASNAPVIVSNGMEILNTERFKSVLQRQSCTCKLFWLMVSAMQSRNTRFCSSV